MGAGALRLVTTLLAQGGEEPPQLSRRGEAVHRRGRGQRVQPLESPIQSLDAAVRRVGAGAPTGRQLAPQDPQPAEAARQVEKDDGVRPLQAEVEGVAP